MTMLQQAIDHYQYGISHDIFSEPVTSYAQLSIDALEKQVPKKPNGEQHCGETYWYCPLCGEWCDSDHVYDNYCNHCGQALDWSEIV